MDHKGDYGAAGDGAGARVVYRTPADFFDPYCRRVVHGGRISQEEGDEPCPVNCEDRRPWCECWCHGTEDGE